MEEWRIQPRSVIHWYAVHIPIAQKKRHAVVKDISVSRREGCRVPSLSRGRSASCSVCGSCENWDRSKTLRRVSSIFRGFTGMCDSIVLRARERRYEGSNQLGHHHKDDGRTPFVLKAQKVPDISASPACRNCRIYQLALVSLIL
jgi:hypothetical protein